MTAGGGDFKPPFGMFLAFDLFEVHAFHEGCIPDGLPVDAHGSDLPRAIEKLHHLCQVLHRHDRQLIGHCRFQGIILREEHPAIAALAGVNGHGKTAGNRLDPAVEGEFAHQDRLFDHLPVDHAHGTQDPDRNGEIEPRPFLFQMRRSQIDRDPLRREMVAAVLQGGFDPVFALADDVVGQPDGREIGQTWR